MKKSVLALLSAAFSAGAAAAPLKVACVGDSITFGFGLADRARESYPAVLQTLLDADSPGAFEVRNFGNSGRGIYLDSMRGNEKRGFRHMPEHRAALEWRPDIVICNLGINDCGEYIKEFAGGRKRGQFRDDYLALLSDYKARNPGVRIYIWTKLAPLAPGQKFYRSPEPFLMQADLEEVARRAGAAGIDMQEPLREKMDSILAKDKIHPDAEGAAIIAGTVRDALKGETRPPAPPAPRPGEEVWLCAGQSNMQKGWNEFASTPEEKRRAAAELSRLDSLDIRFWDFNDGSVKKLTSANAGGKCAYGVSFAIRRAESTHRPVLIVYAAAGGAPAEAFVSERTMCAVDAGGKPLYPALCAIATNRHRLDANADFPPAWVAREYPRRRADRSEAYWWPVSKIYDAGIAPLRGIPLTGILWYQGESNATKCTGRPDKPLPRPYMEETLRAVVSELRAGRNIPFIMTGLPAMDRPWDDYRAAQKKVCAETGAIYVDTFSAGLGDPRDVHPRDKRPFADLAARAAAGIK